MQEYLNHHHLDGLDGELLARLWATGTHRGEFQGVAPTGQRVSVGAFEAWRLRDGRCAEHWLLLDTGALLRQLGLPLDGTVQREWPPAGG